MTLPLVGSAHVRGQGRSGPIRRHEIGLADDEQKDAGAGWRHHLGVAWHIALQDVRDVEQDASLIVRRCRPDAIRALFRSSRVVGRAQHPADEDRIRAFHDRGQVVLGAGTGLRGSRRADRKQREGRPRRHGIPARIAHRVAYTGSGAGLVAARAVLSGSSRVSAPCGPAIGITATTAKARESCGSVPVHAEHQETDADVLLPRAARIRRTARLDLAGGERQRQKEEQCEVADHAHVGRDGGRGDLFRPGSTKAGITPSPSPGGVAAARRALTWRVLSGQLSSVLGT